MTHTPSRSHWSAATVAGTVAPAALTAAALLAPHATASAAPAILAVGLLAGGPHGAFDHRVVRMVVTDPGDTGAALVAYVLAGAGVTAAFVLLPAVTLGVLLAVSVAHFAAADIVWPALRAGRRRDPLDTLAGWVSGTSVVALPLCLHAREASRLLARLAGRPLPVGPDGLRHCLAAVLIGSAVVLAARLGWRQRYLQALELLVVVAVSASAPPAAALGVTFAAVHSARHMARLRDLGVLRRTASASGRAPTPRSTGAALVALLAPLAATVGAVGTLWIAGMPWLRVVLGGMLALTVPHSVVVAALDRRNAAAPSTGSDRVGLVAASIRWGEQSLAPTFRRGPARAEPR